MSNENNKPLETIRDGSVKATIWKNEGENGFFYSVEFARTYSVGDELKDSHSFIGSDILKIQMLAEDAYRMIRHQRSLDAREAKKAASYDKVAEQIAAETA